MKGLHEVDWGIHRLSGDGRMVHSISVMRRILDSPSSRGLVDTYQEALLAHLLRPQEPSLSIAREIGRKAVARGLSLSEMSMIHHESVRKILVRISRMRECGDSGPSQDLCPSLFTSVAAESLFTMAAASFFAECVSPFETDQREFRQANTALRYRNRKLEEQVRRCSRLVSDEALQLVAAASLALDKASCMPAPNGDRKLQEIQSLLDRIGDQLAACADDLWPRVLEDLGLGAAIQSMSRRFSVAARIVIEADTTVNPLLPVVGTILYRAVEESLTNVVRHARATHVRIRLFDEAGVIQCSIGDDGIGFDASEVLSGRAERGSGLISIRESLRAVGGTLTVDSTPGRGTELVMNIPQENRMRDEACLTG
jgi:signal transduction histidine kinase